MPLIHSDPSAGDSLPQYNLAAACHLEFTQDSDNGWMLSFVDLLTLLLTLFVLLLAFTRHSQSAPHHGATADTRTNAPIHSSAAPKSKSAVSPAPAAAGNGTGIAPTSTAAVMKPEAVVSRKTASASLRNPGHAAAQPSSALVHKRKPATASPASTSQAPPFTIPADIRRQVEIAASARRVNLIIRDDVLFDPGSAKLKPAAHTLLQRIAALLKGSSYRVSVEGHTDDRPIHTTRFPSNWELSACRATNVTRYLIAQGIAADRLRAIGFADTRPRAGNGDAAGRARNRRVSLVVHLGKRGSGRAAAKAP